MTAFATPELTAEAAWSGGLRCIDKPLDMDAVARIVEERLSR